MIKIAYVVNHFGMGGLERCVVRLVNHMNRSVFRPMIIVLGTHSEATEWLKVEDVPILEFRKKPGNNPNVVLKLMAVFRENQIDIVHSHNWGTLVETVFARRCAGIKCHIHAERGTVFDTLHSGGLRRRIRGMAMRWALSQVDSVVAVTEATRRQMVDLSGVPPNRIQVIPNGVDCPAIVGVEKDKEARLRSLGVKKGAVVVGSIGRLHPVKNFSSAIDAVALLEKRNRDVHLVLVGEGPEKELLENHAKMHGIENRVHCVGREAHVGLWLDMMDIYINSSISEGMSQALLEAMAMGLPIVATDVGDHGKILREMDTCGLVVPAGKADQMANALEQMILNKDIRDTYGKNALKNFEANFSVQKMILAYEKLYLTLSKNSRYFREKSFKIYEGKGSK